MYLKKLHASLIIPFVINWYLLLKIVFGQHGIIAIQQQKIDIQTNQQTYTKLKDINDNNAIKASLINEDIINLRYLHELLRIQYSIIMPDEKVIILDKTKKNA
jgi:cell division protein FtsB